MLQPELEIQRGGNLIGMSLTELDADMIVIDEASMLDLLLTHNLLKAISPDSHLLLVGDIDQLPSVGAGDVLGDLIESGVTAVVRLETIFPADEPRVAVITGHGLYLRLDRDAKVTPALLRLPSALVGNRRDASFENTLRPLAGLSW